jgi:hypothetical protein
MIEVNRKNLIFAWGMSLVLAIMGTASFCLLRESARIAEISAGM